MKKNLTILVLTCILTNGKSQNINQLRELYTKGEFEKALEISTEIVQKETQNAAHNQIHGRILADLRRFKEAIPFLVKAIEIDSSRTDISGWAYGYLGQCYFMLEKYDDAETSLNKCIKLNSTTNSVNYGKKRLFQFWFDQYFSEWKIIETKNIRFHIQSPNKLGDIKIFIDEREKAFIEIQNYLGCILPKRIDFFVWDNKLEPMEKFKMKLGFADPQMVSVFSSKDQSVGHEMTHVISNYIGNKPIKTGLINEGIAVYLNLEKDNKQKKLETVVERNNLKNLKVLDFWINWKNYSDEISYPFAGAFMQMLIKEFGIERIKLLLINQTYENAKALFGADLDSLISSFEEKLK